LQQNARILSGAWNCQYEIGQRGGLARRDRGKTPRCASSLGASLYLKKERNEECGLLGEVVF
jgi:hypothetical protein